jgi:hypothetical protein
MESYQQNRELYNKNITNRNVAARTSKYIIPSAKRRKDNFGM